MKKSLSLVLIAILAFGIGIAYAAPMLIVPVNIQPYPHAHEGPKAPFSVDLVYANFNTADYNQTEEFNNPDGSINRTETHQWTNVTYNVVLNVTNLSDNPATLYEVTFAAGQDITVKPSIVGGTIYDYGTAPKRYYYDENKFFGGIVDGVYLDGKWVNVTWLPKTYYEVNGTQFQDSYPACLFRITQSHQGNVTWRGPLSPNELEAYSNNHSLNSTIPELPANASDTGIWFEGVPITEYYDRTGNALVTIMYINGAWVDVTGKVTSDNMQPMTTVQNMLVNEVRPFAAQPYGNMNSTIGPITALPSWGDWGTYRTYLGFSFGHSSGQPFNSKFAPHESRLLIFNHTQSFIMTTPQDPPSNGITALKNGNLTMYASASNYITNWPVNGTYYDTVSTNTQVKDIQFELTPNGYTYNNILAPNQYFQPGNSNYEVRIATRTEP